MTATAEVLRDGFARVHDGVHAVLHGISDEVLFHQFDPAANTVAWLVWHLTRIQDDHIADVADRPQQWTSEGWAQRAGLPFQPSATGYGQRADEVVKVRCEPDLLAGYYDAVHAVTLDFVAGLADEDLDRVVDRRFDPPVTLGVRLVSVLSDDLQHVGQAAFVRGVAERLTH